VANLAELHHIVGEVESVTGLKSDELGLHERIDELVVSFHENDPSPDG
jgi:hypothetical protein